MTYVITGACIGTKSASCVEVCPVDCISPTPDEPEFESVDQLHINPEECIDCSACELACPVNACVSKRDLPQEMHTFVDVNADYFRTTRTEQSVR
jgi:NAD-dependent dihydropyrimidine dehydrogenase PreA subunit